MSRLAWILTAIALGNVALGGIVFAVASGPPQPWSVLLAFNSLFVVGGAAWACLCKAIFR